MTGPGCGWSKISRVRAPYDNLGPAVKPLQSPESAVYIMDSLLESNLESFQRGIIGRFLLGGDIVDEPAHLVQDGIQEAVDLGRIPLDYQLNTAIGEVAHVPDDVEAASQPPAGRTKANALNRARKQDAPPFQRHEFSRCSVRFPGMRPA